MMDVVPASSALFQVYPAAGFAARVRRNRHRGKVAVFNLEPSEGGLGFGLGFCLPHSYLSSHVDPPSASRRCLPAADTVTSTVSRSHGRNATGDSEADYVFYGPCEESLPAVLGV